MKTIIALLLAVSGHAAVGPQINGNQINAQTAISIATFTVTGAAPAQVTGAGGLSVTNSVDASSVTAHGAGFVGAGTGLTGTAASLSIGGNAATVTTNANLTGVVTSVGNATSFAASPTFTGTVTGTTGTFTAGITGVTNGTTAPVGDVGEIITGTYGTSVTPPTDTYLAFATMTVTAGRWQMTSTGIATMGATTAATRLIFCISSSNTTCDDFSQDNTFIWDSSAFTVNGSFSAALGPRYVSVSGSTTYYVLCRITYTTAGGVVCGASNRGFHARRF